MIDNLRSMAVFVRVAEAGSFRRAAERLDLSASAVSHHITQLETSLGVQLLYRSTRHVALTDQGQRFFEYCRNMVESAESALSCLHEGQTSGRLRVLLPAPFAAGPMMGMVAAFCECYPAVDMQLEFDDKLRNLIQEGIDVAITMGPLNDSALICRTLFSRAHGLFASPAYLARFGAIESIEDLQKADWVVTPPTPIVVLCHSNGDIREVAPRQRVSANNLFAKYQLALAGVGVARMPPMLVDGDVREGRLKEVLPEWQSENISCYAIYPARTMPNSLSRHFVEFLIQKMEAHDRDTASA